MGVLDRVPLFYLTIDGRDAAADLSRRVVKWSVEESAKKATKISITLEDVDRTLSDGESIVEGMVIGLRWGYPGALSRPVGGVVHKVDPDEDGGTVLVEAYGREVSLSPGAVRRVFRGRTFREALEELARPAGLSVVFEAPDSIRFDSMVLSDESVWSWVLRQSADLGLEVECDAFTNRIHVREPDLAARAAVVLYYNWRNGNVRQWKPERNSRRRRSESEGYVGLLRDPASGRTISHPAHQATVRRAALAARRIEQEAHRQEQSAREQGNAFLTGLLGESERDDGIAATEHAPGTLGTTADAAAQNAQRAGVTPTEDEPWLMVVTETGEPAPGVPGDAQAAQGQPVSVGAAAPAAAAREHVRRVAEARTRQREREKVTVECITDGIPSLRKGMIVDVQGVTTLHAGLWRVLECTHAGDDDYACTLKLTRDGVNGRRGRQQPAAAQQNTQTPAASPTEAQGDTVVVNVENGVEVAG